MQKFTYQNWLDGKIELKDLSEIIYRHGNTYPEGQLYNDVQNILKDQKTAFLKYSKDLFEARKRLFKERYNYTLIRDNYLNNLISDIEILLKQIITIRKEKYEIALHDDELWRELTSKQVKAYLSFDISKHSSSDFILTYLKNINIIEPAKTKITPLTYIVNANFLSWLYWFKEQQLGEKSEPFICRLNENPEDAVVNFTKDAFRSRNSYVWLNDPEKELPELYELLKGKLIESSTTLKQLKGIFTGKPLNEITPVRWHTDNASELLYFILQLEESGNIEKRLTTDYKKLTACFVKPDGSLFTEQFKSLKSNIYNNLSVDKQQVINTLVSNF